MKVVLFCGGLGMRLRELGEDMPKPMVPIGYRPVLWHVMKYYAHFGHKDFILCLGHRADVIKRYFLNYEETVSNDFVLCANGNGNGNGHGERRRGVASASRHIELMNCDIADWRITFADTGGTANIGQRLKAVQHYLHGEERFLANYADGLTDLPLPSFIEQCERADKIATFVSVRPNLSYHAVTAGPDGLVHDIQPITATSLRINGGYFYLRREIFDYMRDGEELVLEPFQRLIAERQLAAHNYDGFFASMDTFKDKQHLEDLHARGKAPWEVWRQVACTV